MVTPLQAKAKEQQATWYRNRRASRIQRAKEQRLQALARINANQHRSFQVEQRRRQQLGTDREARLQRASIQQFNAQQIYKQKQYERQVIQQQRHLNDQSRIQRAKEQRELEEDAQILASLSKPPPRDFRREIEDSGRSFARRANNFYNIQQQRQRDTNRALYQTAVNARPIQVAAGQAHISFLPSPSEARRKLQIERIRNLKEKHTAHRLWELTNQGIEPHHRRWTPYAQLLLWQKYLTSHPSRRHGGDNYKPLWKFK